MKVFKYFTLLALLTGISLAACQSEKKPEQKPPAPQPVSATEMKMTTPLPKGIVSPNQMDSRIGKLEFFDGVPTPESETKIYDYLDFHRGVEAFVNGIQIASMEAIKEGLLKFGPANQTVMLFEGLMDSKSFWLTPNTTSVYMSCWLELGEEPMVIETPPDVLGIIDDHWFQYVADFGRLGPDKSKGGKFLLIPPQYKGKIPEGYFNCATVTNGHWIIWRGFQKDGSTQSAIEATKKHFKIYPLSQKANPPALNFLNISGQFSNTIHRMDEKIYEEINAAVQAEPFEGLNPEIAGTLATIGIEKGKTFRPDGRMQKILKESAAMGSAVVRTLMSKPRDERFFLYPGESVWMNPLVYRRYDFLHNGVRLIDARAAFHFYATGITPAMAAKFIGKGSQYAIAYSDKKGNTLDGSKTYKITIPANPPMKDFWSFTIYDNQTRSMLQTDYQFPGIDSGKKDLLTNPDGSVDIYFSPEAPAGKTENWIQTIPGKGWNVIFRLYGPLEPWFEKSWRPGDPELIEG